MKRLMLILALAGALALIAMPAFAQSDTCVIYGTAYKPDGKTPIDGREMNAPRLSITRATKTGRLYGGTITVTPTPQGVYRFTATRTSSGDTSYIYIKGGLYGFEGGGTYVVPDADSAHISSLIQQAAPPTVHVFRPVVTSTIKIKSPTDSASVPSVLFTGTGVTTTFSGTSQATVTITAGGGTTAYGDSIHVADSLARMALDSVRDARLRLLAVEALAQTAMDSASRARLDAIAALALAGLARDTAALATLRALSALALAQTALDTASRARLDLIATTAIAWAARDTASLATLRALVAQSMASSALSAAATALDSASRARLDLASHISTADAHLPSQTGNSGKFLQSNGTVSSWQTAVTTESDPTAIPRTDSTRFVSRTAPQIPGLASADTNTVIGVDASGNLVLRKDDAGTGGSSIDSNRIVRHDIKAPKVAATVILGDSVVTGTVVRDTLYGRVVSDTITYQVVERMGATGNVVGYAVGGYVKFRWTGKVPLRFSVVSDSANGVIPGITKFEIYNTSYSNPLFGYVSYTIGAISLGSATQSYVTGSANGARYGAYPTTTLAAWVVGTSNKQYNFYLYANDPIGSATVELTVYYAIPVGSSSTWAIKLTDM